VLVRAAYYSLRISDRNRGKTRGRRRTFLCLRIPLKVISDSGLIPIAGSEVKPIIFGAKRRWRSYSA